MAAKYAFQFAMRVPTSHNPPLVFVNCLAMHFAEPKWPNVRDLVRSTPVVIPVSAMEQHGHHMPLFTDSMLATKVVQRAHEALVDKILLAPLMWLGNSHHHIDFPGTVSADPRNYLDLLCGLADSFVSHGFSRIVFINGYDVPARQAIFELRQRCRDRSDLLLLGTYWLLGSQPTELIADLQQQEMGHAGSVCSRTGWDSICGDGRKRRRVLNCFAKDVTSLLGHAVAWDGTTWEG